MQTEAAKPYTERDIIELMVRAPACPEWFEPDASDLKEPNQWDYAKQEERIYGEGKHKVTWYELVEIYPGSSVDLRIARQKRDAEILKRRILQWPRAYAIMVLEAK